MSDSSSVCTSHSTTSISLSKMECPYCNKDLQVRGMFAHIRKFHNDELLKNTKRSWLEDAENGKPLRVYWSKKNDFDEEEEIVIFTCLSTNKTFMTEEKARQHFAKDKAALKDHNKQLKQLRKDFESMKKAAKKAKKQTTENPYILRRNNAFNTNDPELARSIWRGILNGKKVCECAMAICKRKDYHPDYLMAFWNKQQEQQVQIKFSDFIMRHEKLMTKIETLVAAKCMDVMYLHKVFIEVTVFWKNGYEDSIMGFRDDMKQMHPIYDYLGDQRFYDYATEEMEGVDF